MHTAFCVVLCVVFLSSAARAGQITSQYYCIEQAAPQTRYYSAVFTAPETGVAAQMRAAFQQFVLQKYGANNQPLCVYGKVENVQNQIAQAKASGWNIVETNWTYNGAPAIAQTAPAPAAKGMYFVCSVSYYSKLYLSDVIGPSQTPELTGLTNGFHSFVIAKYKLQANAGAASCIYKFSKADAQAYLSHFIASSGGNALATGWKPGTNAAPVAASASPSPSEQPAAAQNNAASVATPAAVGPAPVVQAPPVSTTVVTRLVDPINSAYDPAGKQYRGVVTQASTAGSVSIPVNTLARITVAQSAGAWSTQLSSLSLDGQTVAVTSSGVSATSPVQQNAQKLGSVLSGLGGFGKKAPVAAPAAAAIASGDRVVLPPGTKLTFTVSVPQPSAPASPGATAAPPAPTAAAAPVNAAAANQPLSSNLPPVSNPAGSVVLCGTMNVDGKDYVSAIFAAGNQPSAVYDAAFSKYVLTKFDVETRATCVIHSSMARAQAMLQAWKQQAQQLNYLKIVETGWVYNGP